MLSIRRSYTFFYEYTYGSLGISAVSGISPVSLEYFLNFRLYSCLQVAMFRVPPKPTYDCTSTAVTTSHSTQTLHKNGFYTKIDSNISMCSSVFSFQRALVLVCIHVPTIYRSKSKLPSPYLFCLSHLILSIGTWFLYGILNQQLHINCTILPTNMTQ